MDFTSAGMIYSNIFDTKAKWLPRFPRFYFIFMETSNVVNYSTFFPFTDLDMFLFQNINKFLNIYSRYIHKVYKSVYTQYYKNIFAVN